MTVAITQGGAQLPFEKYLLRLDEPRAGCAVWCCVVYQINEKGLQFVVSEGQLYNIAN